MRGAQRVRISSLQMERGEGERWRLEGWQEGGAASCHRNTRRMAVGRRAVFSRK